MAAPGDWARNAVSSGGYPALAGLILAENLFPPIPSELILPVAGFYVGEGTMHFVLAVLAATLGSVVGALILYAIARFGGRSVVLRLGKFARVREDDLDRADDWFDKRGAWIVLFGRLIPGVRSLVSVPAGLSEMPVMRFTALTALGSTVWNSALIGAGWALGSNYEKVGNIIGPIGTVIVGVCAVGVAVLVFWAVKRRRTAA
ncbi:DedA family protein [Solirubrobacter phytolaccae]|uniref:DedA family protein n=1 Tax=Solirubrobacter phytolaccae TaxID=1404360 RepID=A0A9X3S6C9_9ACTN|nr:DedA family protein [Solirubrobacter phytolaccae]MDA0178953.1 DedA family protein [Solirubrobacter phytolaccae]